MNFLYFREIHDRNDQDILCDGRKLCVAVERLETLYEEKFCCSTSGEIDMAALRT